MLAQTNKGFEESINALQPTPDGALGSAFAVHVIGPARLSSIVGDI
jgi:hypothetical protein